MVTKGSKKGRKKSKKAGSSSKKARSAEMRGRLWKKNREKVQESLRRERSKRKVKGRLTRHKEHPGRIDTTFRRALIEMPPKPGKTDDDLIERKLWLLNNNNEFKKIFAAIAKLPYVNIPMKKYSTRQKLYDKWMKSGKAGDTPSEMDFYVYIDDNEKMSHLEWAYKEYMAQNKGEKKAGMYGDYTPEQEQEQEDIFNQSMKESEEIEQKREMKKHLVNTLTMGDKRINENRKYCSHLFKHLHGLQKKRRISLSQLKTYAKDISRHKEKCQVDHDIVACDYCRKEYDKWIALHKTEEKVKKKQRTKQRPSELRKKLAVKAVINKRGSKKGAKRGKKNTKKVQRRK